MDWRPLVLCAGLLTGCPKEDGMVSPTVRAGDQEDLGHILDAWHRAAAEADPEAYFGRIAGDGVFLGT